MTVRSPRWRIDAGLAKDLAGLLAWAPDDGIAALVARMNATIPAGSTSKLEAIEQGVVPPGGDIEAVSRTIITGRERGDREPSWSCWVYATMVAALVETFGVASAQVVASRRLDAGDAVDFHSAVTTDDGTERWLCDPFFNAVLPGPGADEVEIITNGIWAMRIDGEVPGHWSYKMGNGRMTRLDYRMVAPDLTASDVRALCDVSLQFTGVPFRRGVRFWDEDAIVDLWEREDGVVGLRDWRWSGSSVWEGEMRRTTFTSWDEGTEALAARTGVRVR